MKGYSEDLRKKIVKAYDKGEGSQRELARIFGVGLATIQRWLKRRRETGSIAAKAHGGGATALLNEERLKIVRELVKEVPDGTLEELGALLKDKTGVEVSGPTMSRVLKKLGLGRKKNLFTPQRGIRREWRN